MLQHVAASCSALQGITPLVCVRNLYAWLYMYSLSTQIERDAVFCSLLQCVAVRRVTCMHESRLARPHTSRHATHNSEQTLYNNKS